jgi:hypothetical protein
MRDASSGKSNMMSDRPALDRRMRWAAPPVYRAAVTRSHVADLATSHLEGLSVVGNATEISLYSEFVQPDLVDSVRSHVEHGGARTTGDDRDLRWTDITSDNGIIAIDASVS